jgi:hypothetical protein
VSDSHLPSHSPRRALKHSGSGGKAVLDTVAKDALDVALRRAGKRYRVGEFELGEDSYQQVLIWAEVSGLSPEEVMEKAWGAWRAQFSQVNEEAVFLKNHGFRNLAVFPEIVVDGLFDLSKASDLKGLTCRKSKLIELNLIGAPALTRLSCSRNNLTELDLSNVPALDVLGCGNNQLNELELSNTPGLGVLYCNKNHLVKLDLTQVQGLSVLACANNQITKLDLSRVSSLASLSCGSNNLTELDLSQVPLLISLDLEDNQLKVLDLSAVSALSRLDCLNNPLLTLDVTTCLELKYIRCDSGVEIIKLDDQEIEIEYV